ncbi:MAG: DUF2294 family protein [Leptolyngbya sp. SIO4C1]|nr:DUF2294 family protein [Leptolyngbya sp. SIO4C1]
MSYSPSKTPATEETALPEQVSHLYARLFNHQLRSASCHFLAPDRLAIVLDDFATPAERLLLSSGKEALTQEWREKLNHIFQRRLRETLETSLQQPVEDLISQYQLRTGRISILVVFGKH